LVVDKHGYNYEKKQVARGKATTQATTHNNNNNNNNNNNLLNGLYYLIGKNFYFQN